MLQLPTVSATPERIAAEERIGLALRQAAYALDDADRVLRSILHHNTWSSSGMRALGREVTSERLQLAGLRSVLREFRSS